MILEYMKKNRLSSLWLKGYRCQRCDSANVFFETGYDRKGCPVREVRCLTCAGSRDVTTEEIEKLYA